MAVMISKKARIVEALILGFFLAGVILCTYMMPVISNEIELNREAVVMSLNTTSWIHTYGIIWIGITTGIAIALYKTMFFEIMKTGKPRLILIIISIVFSFLNVGGFTLYYMDSLPFTKGWFWFVFSILLSFGWAIIFYTSAVWFLWLLDNKLFNYNIVGFPQKTEKTTHLLYFLDKHTFLTAFIVIMIGWLPWIIFFYPASIENDAYWMLASYFEYIPKTNHHPWFASCVLAFFYEIGFWAGDTNIGFFLFVIFRDLIIALIYANCISLLKRSGIKRSVYICVMFFYAFTPVWGAYAKHAFKDTFAAALFCLYITSFVILIKKVETNSDTWTDFAFYGLSGLMASLWRNNVIYCVVPATIILVKYLFIRRVNIQRILVVLICVSLYFGFYGYLYNIEGINRSNISESMSVFVQATARTVRDHGKELTAADRQTINAYLGYDGLAESYKPIFSDPVKWRLHGSITDYLNSWVKLGMRYPLTYVEAIYSMGYGYVAFTPKQSADSNNGNSGMSLFHGIESEMFPKLVRESYIEKWSNERQMLIHWAKLWERIPVVNLTNTIALYTWIGVLLVFYLLSHKMFSQMIPFVPMFLLVLTCMASPVNDCFRYFAGFAAALPVTLTLLSEVVNAEK